MLQGVNARFYWAITAGHFVSTAEREGMPMLCVMRLDGCMCRLDAALAADTAFLAGLGVMDYSLLLGVDRQNRQLVVGIIDFVRQVCCKTSV